jgi:WD repeat-containing protein 35
VQYFTSAKDPEALVECYYRLEEYQLLEKLVRVIPEGSPLLMDIGNKFQAVGLSESASMAFLKAGDVKAAIDCCVLLNCWDKAVQLAQEHEFPQIEGLLAKYASHLLDKGDKLQAIELYRKAGKSTQAATLLASLARDAGRTKVDPLGAKKLHVLAAMEMEEMRTKVLDSQLKTMVGGPEQDDEAKTQREMDEEFELGTMSRPKRSTQKNLAMTAAQATAATLESLVGLDSMTAENRSLDSAWHGAEGFHLFMLAQRQLYAKRFKDALVTSLQLRAYDDIIDPRDVYSLIALAAMYNGAWGQCSKAFIELESLKKSSCTSEERDQFAELALAIFTENRPVDPPEITQLVDSIDKGRAKGHPCCMISGKPIDETAASRYKCRRCSRKMLEAEIQAINNCPLCHMMLV